MSALLCIISSLLLSVCPNEAARILAVFPTPSISHQVVYRPLTQELAKRGHEVIVVTTDPAFPKDRAPPNLTEIEVHDISYKIWMEQFIAASKDTHNNIVAQISSIFIAAVKIFEAQLKDEQVQKIIKDKSQKFDLIIVEACARGALAFSHIYKAPVIQVSSFYATVDNFNVVGAPTHPLLYPVMINRRINNLTMTEKVTELYNYYNLVHVSNQLKPYEEKMLRKYFGNDMPPFDELHNNVDMLFLNINPIFEGIRPMPPNVIFMGGLHQNPDKELPAELKKYLDSSKNGVIYISFGTNVDPAMLPPEKIQVLVKTVSKLPYDVLWKWNQDELPGRTDNIRISKWLPQSDLLKHPNVKLFVTQGGLQSTDEAITAGVPLIGMPMIADQWFNVERYEYHKIGIRVEFETVTVEEFTKAINTILKDDSYRNNVIKLRDIMRDEPMKPLERAVWWTEYVLRHGGAKHLKSPSANISWSEFLELELVFTVLGVLLVIIAIIAMILRSILRLIFRDVVSDKKKHGDLKKFNLSLRTTSCLSVYSDKMSFLQSFVFCFCLVISAIEAAKILAVFPIPSISHQVVFRPLTQALAKRGHEVTVITPDPAFTNTRAPPNLTEIDVHDISYNIWKEKFMSTAKGNEDDFLDQMDAIMEAITSIVDIQLKDKRVLEIVQGKNQKFDLILAEACVRTALVFSHVYKVPVIQVSSFGAVFDNFAAVGAPNHPLLYPTLMRQKLNNLTKWEKLSELYNHYRTEYVFEKFKTREHALLSKHVGNDLPSIDELSQNVDMLLLNVNPIFEGIRPVPPNVIYMGGLHQNPEKELPTDLKSYLDSSKNGVIYISFGTNVDPSLLPPERIQILVKTFSKLPYDVLWKWNKDELPGRTSNIRISKWLPQSDLLKHPKIKLFVTQGGLQSTDEAITAGVPLIGMPMLGDQWFNVERYEYHRIGIRLDLDELTEETFTKTINTIINNDSYRRNVVKLRDIMRDQPMKPLDRAVWWTEYVLRHGGAKHLRSPAANISWAEYLELELVFTVLAVLLAISATAFIALRSIYTFVVKNVSVKIKSA
ncbi:uncharacterized protein LOC142982983 [Anticarsia gemmatalis]|uniref:uncharacterized protein LOC142982983 n=1 Tax=Anticarsia gemmatalis TaxID=129554 RepID=UPI003F761420